MTKTLLITGASAGIGAATARLAAQQGYDVAINYNSNAEAAEAVAEDVRRAGARAELVQGDVADPDQITAMFARIDDSFGRLDALVNNAGVVDQTARVADFTHARLRRMFDINVIGAMLVAKEAVTRMLAQGTGGAIVNISSAAARLGSGNQYVDYAASKAAIAAGLNRSSSGSASIRNVAPSARTASRSQRGGRVSPASRSTRN